ncbi:preprotein translocase subunit Sss1 [Bradyrhizobium sp. OAE829]
MRSQSDSLLVLPLLPIFLIGVPPILLFTLLGFAGFVILGVLLICVGLTERLEANSDFNQQIIVHGYARRSERMIQASNLHSAIRFATIIDLAGAGLIVVGLLGFFYLG